MSNIILNQQAINDMLDFCDNYELIWTIKDNLSLLSHATDAEQIRTITAETIELIQNNISFDTSFIVLS